MTWCSLRCCPLTRFAYNLLLIVLAPLAVPYWAIRSHIKGHSRSSQAESLGRIAIQRDTTRPPAIWFHAASVGEIQSSLSLLSTLRDRLPAVPLYISTGTPAGRRLAEERLGTVATAVFRAPIDLPWCVGTVFRNLAPRLLIVSETEIWPNLFFEAKRHGVSTMIVNARISDRSAPNYRRLRFAFRAVLECVDTILAQSRTDRERLLDAGADPSHTGVGGNLKYDFPSRDLLQDLPPDLQGFIDSARPDLVLVAGSTREGEEAALVPALRNVVTRIGRTLLIVAPRHPRRTEEAESALRDLGLPMYRRTRLPPAGALDLPGVLLLDSVGELTSLYRRADIVFVGGSLNGWGGHNVLEPVAFSKAVVVGPYMQNFREITAGLLTAGGLVQVQGAAELSTVLPALAEDVERREAIGRKGFAFADSQRGATERAANEALRLYRCAIPRTPPSFSRHATLGMPSMLWSVVAHARRKGYTTGLMVSRRLKLPVVSVGNLTAGGTGKTPTVAWLVEQLWQHGHTAGVLTRGYGRRRPGRLAVIEADARANPDEVGDEPAMLARRFAASAPKTVFAAHPDRFVGGQALEKRGGCDLLVMDDGFQHMQLHRTLDLVLLDTTAPFGNGHALPLGRLREPASAIRHADAVLLTRCSPSFHDDRIRTFVRDTNPDVPVFRSTMTATTLVDLATGQPASIEALAGQRIGAFCGIGNPQSFFGEIRNCGGTTVFERSYRDHHRYTGRDRLTLKREAIASSADLLLTTEKDGLNLGDASELGLPVLTLQIALQVEDPDRLLRLLLSRLK